jgi:hypothetical protein
MKQTRALALTVAAAVGCSLLAAVPAHAGSAGHRNTALLAGAVGVYGVVKKKPLVAGLGLGVAGYSFARYQETRAKEKKRSKRVYVRKVRRC